MIAGRAPRCRNWCIRSVPVLIFALGSAGSFILPGLFSVHAADEGRDQVRPLSDNQLFRHLPVSSRICRVYTPPGSEDLDAVVARAMDELIGSSGPDDLTNM